MSSAPSNPSDPIFRIEALPAGDGQCLLVHLGTVADPRLVIVDGGPRETWENELKPRLEQIRQERGVRKLHIDAVIVTVWANENVDGFLPMAREAIDINQSEVEIGLAFFPEAQEEIIEKWFEVQSYISECCKSCYYFPEAHYMPSMFDLPDMIFALKIEKDIHVITEGKTCYVRAITISFQEKQIRIHSRVFSQDDDKYSFAKNNLQVRAELMVFRDLKTANLYREGEHFSFSVNRLLILNDYLDDIDYSKKDIISIQKMLHEAKKFFMLAREPKFPKRISDSWSVTSARYPEIISYDLFNNDMVLFTPRYHTPKIDVDILYLIFLLALEHRLPSQSLLKPTPSALSRALASSDPPIFRPEHVTDLVQRLRRRYPGAEPNPLWVAWMRETQADAIAKLTESLPDLLIGDGAPPSS